MTKINMKITHLNCHKNLPGANELKSHELPYELSQPNWW